MQCDPNVGVLRQSLGSVEDLDAKRGSRRSGPKSVSTRKSIMLLELINLLQSEISFDFRINVNMKKSVYCTAVANGGEEEWDFAWDRYQKSNVATEKSNMLSSMGCTKEVICP